MDEQSPQEEPLYGLQPGEVDELDEFLAREDIEDTSLDLVGIRGFLAAVAIGPDSVVPGLWLDFLWDAEAGEMLPPFDDVAHARHLLGLVRRLHDDTVACVLDDDRLRDEIDSAIADGVLDAWCSGFLFGIGVDDTAWMPLFNREEQSLEAFERLGTEEGEAECAERGDRVYWEHQIVPSVLRIRAFWAARNRRPAGPLADGALEFAIPVEQFVRPGPKVGRNDPCPCGSGKKYKKCCGSGVAG